MAKKRRTSGQVPSKTLPQRAEELARTSPIDIAGMTSDEVLRLIHELQVHQIELELQVHQIELELQNEELRQAQVELAHSRDQSSDLYEFAPTGYVTLDADGKIQNANLTTAAMLGVERQHLRQARLSNFVNRESQDEFYLHRRAVLAEVINYRKDGTPYDAELFITPLFNAEGRRTNFVSIHRDITERKRAENLLRKERNRAQQYLDVSGVIMVALDSQGDITLINHKGCEVLGFDEHELLGKSWFDTCLPEGCRNDVRSVFQQVMNGTVADVEYFENPVLTRTGGERIVEWHNSEIRDETGRVVGVLGSGTDITGRRQAERALRDREERMQAILNTAADAIITIDRRGIIIAVNPATEKMFGYTQDELVGQNVKILMPPPYHNEHDGYIQRYLETAEARIIGIGREVVGRRKDGSSFPIGLAVSEVDHLHLFTGIIRDMSEQRKLQRDVVAIAEDEQRRIGQDLHDSTQQELAGLGMLAQTLFRILTQESGDRPKASLDIDKCCELAKKILEGLTRAHQEVQSISRGLIPMRLDPAALMDALRELASRTDELPGVTCAFKCEQPVEVAESFTTTHLYRIAQEAITNALKHARPEHILIALESDNGQPTLQVADDGTGFNSSERSEGMGLKTMQYRASLIGANLTISPVDTGGTLVTCKVFRGGGVNHDD